MEATPGEDAPSNSMVKNSVGKFKRGRERLEDNSFLEDRTKPGFVSFSIFKVKKVRKR